VLCTAYVVLTFHILDCIGFYGNKDDDDEFVTQALDTIHIVHFYKTASNPP
jgi:hypothetical protein